MHRTSTDAEWLDNGIIRVDADGIPVTLPQGPPTLSGTGFPEGRVSSPAGAVYTDIAETAGAIRWIKTGGTGNTGWAVEYGDTGWRDVADTAVAPVTVDTGGAILLRRINSEVYWKLRGVRLEAATGDRNMVPIPVGFRQSETRQVLYAGPTDHQPETFLISSSLWFLRYRGSDAGLLSDVDYSINLTAVTDNQWPSSLPGTPA